MDILKSLIEGGLASVTNSLKDVVREYFKTPGAAREEAERVQKALSENTQLDLNRKHELELLKLQLELHANELEFDDRVNAREVEVNLQGSLVSLYARHGAALVAVLGFLSVIGVLIFKSSELHNEKLTYGLVGFLGKITYDVYAYYFGRSKEDKDEKGPNVPFGLITAATLTTLAY